MQNKSPLGIISINDVKSRKQDDIFTLDKSRSSVNNNPYSQANLQRQDQHYPNGSLNPPALDLTMQKCPPPKKRSLSPQTVKSASRSPSKSRGQASRSLYSSPGKLQTVKTQATIKSTSVEDRHPEWKLNRPSIKDRFQMHSNLVNAGKENDKVRNAMSNWGD